MEVEVRVTDRKGQVVADLSKEDFELRERGSPQKISVFEFVRGPGPARQGTEAAPATETAASDALRRSTFIYVATKGRRQDKPHIYRAVRDFIDRHLAPGIFVSLNGTPFTSKASELHRTLAAMFRSPGGGQGFVDTLAVDLARDIEYGSGIEEMLAETGDEFEAGMESIQDRAALYRRLRMYEYIDLIRALSVYPGRKLVVLFSTGLPVEESNLDLMQVLEDEATRARVRFYVSDVSRLSAESPGGDAESKGDTAALFGNRANDGFRMRSERRQNNQDSLYELARRTGGRAVLNDNDFGAVFDVVNRASGDYYLLGYYPEDTEQRGRYRRIRVRVRREGLRTSAQRGYFEERPFEMMSQRERNLRIHQALTFDTPYWDLPLRVSHEYFRAADGSARLVYSVGMHVADIPAESTAQGKRLKVTVVAQAKPARSGEGRPKPILDERQFVLNVRKRAIEPAGNDSTSWLHYSSQMQLPPGAYEWKVVAREDVSGALGSFKTEVQIPGTGRPGSSTLLLTGRIDDVSSKPAKGREETREDVLEVAGSRFFASAVNVFQRGNPIYVLYDAYHPGSGAMANPPGPRLALYRGRELVEKIPVTGHQTVPEPAASRIRHLAALATTDLPAGDYTLAAMLPSGSGPAPVVQRKFQIVEAAAE